MAPNYFKESQLKTDVPQAVAARVERLVERAQSADVEMPWERGARREAMIARRRSRQLLQAD